jgi:nucleoid DNA-binding protein
MNRKSQGGKTKLVQEVIAKGFSVRKARKAVTAVFDRIRRAVLRGEVVEIPGGTLRA